MNLETSEAYLVEAVRLAARAERTMKIAFTICGLSLGILLGNVFILRPQTGRYIVHTHAPPGAPAYLIRVDTATGKAWFFNGTWVLMREKPDKTTGTNEFGGMPVQTAPVTFVPSDFGK